MIDKLKCRIIFRGDLYDVDSRILVADPLVADSACDARDSANDGIHAHFVKDTEPRESAVLD